MTCRLKIAAPALKVICEQALAGVVSKRRTSRYRWGDRGWLETKNAYWRHDSEIEAHSKPSITLDLYVGEFEKRKVNDSGQRLAAAYAGVLDTRI